MCDNNSYIIEMNEDNENLERYSQKYVYKFDDPLVQDYGYVQVCNNHITVQFPVKPDHTQAVTNMHHVQLYVNNEMLFYSDWLPILTQQDEAKSKTIFYQLWYEYSKLTQFKYWPSSSFVPLMHSELVTIFDRPAYYLSCFENHSITLLELETKETMNTPLSQPNSVHIQFYLGPYLIFCSKTHLKHFNVNTLHFVLSFILQKFIN
jgi:hypothetical protein